MTTRKITRPSEPPSWRRCHRRGGKTTRRVLRQQRRRRRRHHLFAHQSTAPFVTPRETTKKNRSIRRPSLRGGRECERCRCASYTNARHRVSHRHRFENGARFRLEKDGPLKTLQKKEYHGRTVFGIVSRAIRPRRCGCHRDYLRVCRQRRVEFGASSLALLLVLVFVVALCVRWGISRLSSFTSFVSFSRLISRRKLTAACARRRSHRRFTGETIAEIGKEALKTIDWSTKTPT